jgi:hypothetical protein
LHDLKNLLNVVKNYDHRGREERESLSKNVCRLPFKKCLTGAFHGFILLGKN